MIFLADRESQTANRQTQKKPQPNWLWDNANSQQQITDI